MFLPFVFAGLLRCVVEELLLQFLAQEHLVLQVVLQLLDERLVLPDGLLQLFALVLFLLQFHLNLPSQVASVVQFLRQLVPLVVVVPLLEKKVVVLQLPIVDLLGGDVFVQLLELLAQIEVVLAELLVLELPMDEFVLELVHVRHLPAVALVVMLQLEIVVFERFVVLRVLLVHFAALLTGQVFTSELIVLQLQADDTLVQRTFAFLDDGQMIVFDLNEPIDHRC